MPHLNGKSELNRLRKKRLSHQVHNKIDVNLSARGYLAEKIEGRFYWHWHSPGSLHFYVNHGTLGTNTIFLDARLVELKEILSWVVGVLPSTRGMSTNHKFELFKLKRERLDGFIEYEGWGFQFKDERAFEKFLDICEVFAREGLTASMQKALQFQQVAGPVTGKSVQIESRVGQGKFKTSLQKYWKVCAVTGIYVTGLLRASHIKPWALATPKERLDPFNGLLLLPTLDALFDIGLITFDEQGKIVISSKLTGSEVTALGLSAELKLKKINGAHLPYLKFHNEHVFQR